VSAQLVPDALRAKMSAASASIDRLKAILAQAADEDQCRKLGRGELKHELLDMRAAIANYLSELEGLHFQYSGLASEAINRAKREAGS